MNEEIDYTVSLPILVIAGNKRGALDKAIALLATAGIEWDATYVDENKMVEPC